MSSLKVPIAESARAASKLYLDYLDGLRAIAALYVLIYHAGLQIQNPQSNRMITVLQAIFSQGHYAVSLFIVLSGFCLMLPLTRSNGELRGGVMRFLKRRARRILPPYYLAMGISLLLIATLIGTPTGTHWDVSIPVSLEDVLWHGLLLQDVVATTTSKINHVFWSISVEWRIYFLFPLLVMGWRRFGALKTTIVTTMLSYLALIVLFKAGATVSATQICPHYVALFSIGMLSAGIAFPYRQSLVNLQLAMPWQRVTLGLTVLLLGMAAIDKLVLKTVDIWAIADLVLGIWAACLLVVIARQEQLWIHRILSWKPLVFVGTFAYSLYLIHAPVLQVVWQYFLQPPHTFSMIEPFGMYLVGVPFCIAIAHLFYSAFERPFLNRKP